MRSSRGLYTSAAGTRRVAQTGMCFLKPRDDILDAYPIYSASLFGPQYKKRSIQDEPDARAVGAVGAGEESTV